MHEIVWNMCYVLDLTDPQEISYCRTAAEEEPRRQPDNYGGYSYGTTNTCTKGAGMLCCTYDIGWLLPQFQTSPNVQNRYQTKWQAFMKLTSTYVLYSKVLHAWQVYAIPVMPKIEACQGA